MKFWETDRRRLAISFSGGKTSAYLSRVLKSEWACLWDEIVVAFMNTGKEHPKTLEYVHNCDRHYRFGVVWLEAVVNPVIGEGTTHKIVTFETAARDGEPFERVIEKYGIPNTHYPHCTREMKANVMTSYLRSLGWEPGTYNTAIGIRADEMGRISPKNIREIGAIYPLIDLGVIKKTVLDWELGEPVRLGISEEDGNCRTCFKKTFRKLATIYQKDPQAFEFFDRMQRTHANTGRGEGDRRFFRGRKTVADIAAMAADPNFVPFVDDHPFTDEEMDTGSACGESCEIGVDGPEEVAQPNSTP